MRADSALNLIAHHHNISTIELLSESRTDKVVKARHEFFYTCMRDCGKPAAWVGGRYGFHHTTVMYGAAKHAETHGLPSVTAFNLKGRRERWRLERNSTKEAAE